MPEFKGFYVRLMKKTEKAIFVNRIRKMVRFELGKEIEEDFFVLSRA